MQDSFVTVDVGDGTTASGCVSKALVKGDDARFFIEIRDVNADFSALAHKYG